MKSTSTIWSSGFRTDGTATLAAAVVRSRVVSASVSPLLRRPDMLLLDEATSQLDTTHELALRETIIRLARQTTVVIIAHRMATVTAADTIAVLDAGALIATGTHRELIAASAIYRALAATQLTSAH